MFSCKGKLKNTQKWQDNQALHRRIQENIWLEQLKNVQLEQKTEN